MLIQPYLFFEGRCEEALNFYRDKLGAEILMMMRRRESPEPPTSGAGQPDLDDKIMHASFKIGDTTLMGSDGNCTGTPDFKGVALSITTASEDEARQRYEALSDGGQPFMPMQQTFYSPAFGMLKDRFGLNWMVMALPEGQKTS
jgi:PhnB protein